MPKRSPIICLYVYVGGIDKKNFLIALCRTFIRSKTDYSLLFQFGSLEFFAKVPKICKS